MSLPRPCLTHPRVLARPGTSYCDACTKAQASRKNRRRGDGSGARKHLRQWVNLNGGGVCYRCERWHPAADLEIDHVMPLAAGGRDVPSNVRPCCKPCHRGKRPF